ncbi:MAG TPA: glycoside hydrolase family 2 TIM barrel-domain containing protein, partial [bacterium]|nr:glycoside hydrolase family 2 TIM barrel-domain containing protein [bacterium]
MKTERVFFLAVLLIALLTNTPIQAENDGRCVLSLDGVWRFCPAFEELQYNHAFLQENLSNQRTYSKEDPDKNYGWIEPDFDDEAWWDINVPSSWNQSFPDLWSYEGHGWYRKKVFIPEYWKYKRVLFVSDGANYRTVLYVNGNKAGVHEGGYVRFSFPIQEYLKFGEENTLAVSVDNLSLPERCPSERHDWWNHGGLYRSVRLEASNRIYIDDVKIVADATASPPTIQVEPVVRAELGSGNPVPPNLVLRTELYSSIGDFMACHIGGLHFERDVASVTSTFPVENVLLWSPDKPYLYRIVLGIYREGGNQAIDQWSTRVGIRSIQIEKDQLLLNGKPLLIQGVNRYENYADTGMTPNDTALRQDIHLMKQMGVNAVRCHYTHSPETYDLYDEAGLLTICEVPLYQWGRPGHSTKNLDAAKVQLTEMI